MEAASLFLKPTEKLLYATSEELIKTMKMTQSLIHCIINSDHITRTEWGEIEEINNWVRTTLSPLLREIIKEEESTRAPHTNRNKEDVNCIEEKLTKKDKVLTYA